MSTKYLLVTSLVAILLASVGVFIITLLAQGPYPMPQRWDDIPAGVRFLAGPELHDWVNHATPATIDREILRVFARAAQHAWIAKLMLAALGLAGLMGLARLRVRGFGVFAVLILVLALLGGGAFLVADDAARLGGPLAAVMMLVAIALTFTVNLMPDFTHPFMQHAERELLALPKSRRRRYVIRRVVIGAGLALVGVVATVVSFAVAAALGGRVAVVALGAIAGGTSSMLMPILAATRLHLRGR